MLHAFLHNKLDPLRPEPDRLEDALTSAVFGTLAMVEAAGVLAEWLDQAEPVGAGAAVPPVPARLDDLWLWPALGQAEPDVAIRMGPLLVVVEAKLRSGRHDRRARAGDPDGLESDQIRRQWASLTGERRCADDDELARALRECTPVLVCVVDLARAGRARRELAESARGLPENADLRLLTWQALHAVLVRRGRGHARLPRWISVLAEVLERFGVAGFSGFDGPAACLDKEAADRVAAFRLDTGEEPFGWDRPELLRGKEALRGLAPFLLAAERMPDEPTGGAP